MLYQISRGSKAFGTETVFEDIQFEIRGTEKIAVVGRNGCGKSTLLKIMTGELELDKGEIHSTSGTRIGYLAQTTSVSYTHLDVYKRQGFVYVNAPIITGNDAEGAGEVFTVTTRDDGNYEEDFFGKKANLTVSGQLQAEAFAMAFRDVYTFGPTFLSLIHICKTTLTQGIARGLGITRTVSSPTFTILKIYQGRLPLYHLDVYKRQEMDVLIGKIKRKESPFNQKEIECLYHEYLELLHATLQNPDREKL